MNVIKFMDEICYVDECKQKFDEPGWMWMSVDESGRDQRNEDECECPLFHV